MADQRPFSFKDLDEPLDDGRGILLRTYQHVREPAIDGELRRRNLPIEGSNSKLHIILIQVDTPSAVARLHITPQPAQRRHGLLWMGACPINDDTLDQQTVDKLRQDFMDRYNDLYKFAFADSESEAIQTLENELMRRADENAGNYRSRD